LDPQDFKDVMAAFPSGVTIVTTRDEVGAPQGATVSAFMSLSLDPPLVAVGLAKQANCLSLINYQGYFAVNFLAVGRDALSARFATPAVDRFEATQWVEVATGSPVLEAEVVGFVDCVVHEIVEAGDHSLVIGRVVAASAHGEREPLLYFRRRYGQVAVA
jgi:flavin reductase (DIM6/NTAB) family NADH-FMN oxidoreductase RutF